MQRHFFLFSRLVLFVSFLCATSFLVEAQQNALPDSLRSILDASVGKEKILTLLKLSKTYKNDYPAQAFFLAEEALEEAKSINSPQLTAKTSMHLGLLYRNRGDYREGLSLFLETLNYAQTLNDRKLQAQALHKMASSHLWLFEYKESFRYAAQEVEIWQELQDSVGLAKGLNLQGLVLSNLGQYDSAYQILTEALALAEQLNNQDLRYKTTLNIGDNYLKQGEADKALVRMNESLTIVKRLGSRFGLAIVQLKMGQAYAAKKDYDAAVGNLKAGLEEAKTIRASSVVRNGYKYLMETHQKMGAYQDAFTYLQKYQVLNDSLLTAASRQNITQLKAQYQIEEKESENKILRQQNKIQNYQSYSLAIFALLVLSLGFLLWWRYREKEQANQVLQAQNKEIQEKSEELATQSLLLSKKNQAISDSVNYAKRIQDALQVNESDIFLRYSEYFIFARPKDVVSGDVYWFAQKADDTYVFAVADCTGHGIPGALMTILCNTLLNDITEDHADYTPEQMLYELDERLKKILHQKVSGINDGMEIAICAINPEGQEITYAGAKLPLIHYEAGAESCVIHQPSVFPIGGHEFKSKKTFKQEVIPFKKGDSIYISSDGYQDQFGGPRNRKFMRKNFRKLLDQIHSLPMEEQQVALESRHLEWRGSEEQTDDILVFGMRL